jgi:hypothetical protein
MAASHSTKYQFAQLGTTFRSGLYHKGRWSGRLSVRTVSGTTRRLMDEGRGYFFGKGTGSARGGSAFG